MATRSLPHRPSFEHLRNEARALQRRVRDADPEALARAREFHPRFEERVGAFRLSDAQLTIARSYGHASWPKLKTYVEAVTTYARDPHEIAPLDDDAGEFLRLACLVYGGDDLTRPARAAEMLRRDASLSGRSIHAAAAAGDARAARDLLVADPALATAIGGPFRWEPLLYVAYARIPGRDHLAVARLLLEAGADANAGYLWDGTYLFTALTGAFGYGEDAPNQPPHPDSIALAHLLLDAGADANDDQTIYNRHFRPENDYLELLLAHGLGGPRRGPWPGRLGEHLADPGRLLEDALVFVADNDAYADRVALLLRHGVDPDGRGTRHPALRNRRPIERARAHGATRIEALLLAAGAEAPTSDTVDHLLASCMRGDRDRVDGELAGDAALATAVIQRHPRALIDAAGRANVGAVELLAHIGYDVNLRDGQTALHLAAYAGSRPMCELLLGLGADPAIRDTAYEGTAADWARHAHHDELAASLDATA